jgi:hypothetical protein
MRRNILVLVAIIISHSAYGQYDSLFGQFKFHQSWYYTLTLTLNKNGEFKLIEASDIGGNKAIGTWKVSKDKIKMYPKQFMSLSQQSEKVIEKKDTWLGGVFEANVLGKDEVFIETNNKHIHLKRSHAPENQSYKVMFYENQYLIEGAEQKAILKTIVNTLKQYGSKGYIIKIIFYPSHSRLEANQDKYIGLKRSKEMVDYIIHETNFDEKDFIIMDLDFEDSLRESYTLVHIEFIEWHD